VNDVDDDLHDHGDDESEDNRHMQRFQRIFHGDPPLEGSATVTTKRSKEKTGTSYCAELVRRLDYDRFLCTLFAPAGRREALFALYALNTELARIRESVTEPLLGAIRLQWWRERIDALFEGKGAGRHASEVVAALAAAIGERRLPRGPFEILLDAREFDLSEEPPEDLAALEAYAEATAGSLAVLTLEALAPPEEPREEGSEGDGESNDAARAAALAAAREAGAAFGLLGLVRSVPFHARWNRVVLPRSLLERAGVRPSDVVEGRARDRLAPVAAEIAAAAASRLSPGPICGGSSGGDTTCSTAA
jgi:NADH dehydrogenase [ubiquinone] 1 alpha subcomplex assembly factor 6